jgi:hypothetical protein
MAFRGGYAVLRRNGLFGRCIALCTSEAVLAWLLTGSGLIASKSRASA